MKQKLNIIFENLGGNVGVITLKVLKNSFKPALKLASLKYKTRVYSFNEISKDKFIISIIGTEEEIKEEQQDLIKGLTKMVSQYQEKKENKKLLKRLGEKAIKPIKKALNNAYMNIGVYVTWEIKNLV